MGLWLVPFRGIPDTPDTEDSFELDLLYLDQAGRVIDAVESFPVFRVNSSSPATASVLALPAHSISSTETVPGDVLTVCAVEEMASFLERNTSGGVAANDGRGAVPEPICSGREPLRSPLPR